MFAALQNTQPRRLFKADWKKKNASSQVRAVPPIKVSTHWQPQPAPLALNLMSYSPLDIKTASHILEKQNRLVI